MQNQRSFAAIEQDIFSASRHLANFRSPQDLVQIRCHRPAQLGISYPRRSNPPTFKVGYDPAANDFDFR
jgi:hypothetical protein